MNVSKLVSFCRNKVAEMKEQLPQIQEQLAGQINEHLAPWVLSLGSGDVVHVGGRRLRLLRKLGEGGYSLVYLAREVPSEDGKRASSGPEQMYALKKVLAGGEGQLAEAQHEIDVMHRLSHPNVLPLLDSAVVSTGAGAGAGATHIVYMLFPLYASNMWDAVQQRLQAGAPLTPSEVAHVFVQLCTALEAMHAAPSPGLAHRDVKPHNILLRRRPEGHCGRTGAATAAAASPAGPTGADDAAHLVAGRSAAEGAVDEQALPPFDQCQVVLMDFGSAAPARVEIRTRSQAVALQEDAEAPVSSDCGTAVILQSLVAGSAAPAPQRLCSAPYRAPELWDVPSSCTVDERIDVWAAGCVLYYLMVGVSPFERAADHAGGSLMLAVVNGQYSWPEVARRQYPQALRDLATACLTVDPAQRPFVADVKAKAQALDVEMRCRNLL